MRKEKLPARRAYIVVAFVAFWGLGIGVRLYSLQVVQSSDYRERARSKQERTLQVTPQRGIIYSSDGKELAMSIKVDSVYVDPSEIDDLQATAKALSRILGVPAADLLQRFTPKDPKAPRKTFAWVKRKIKDSERTAIESLQLQGVYFQKESRRYYPNRQLAAHVLGYVDIDEEGLGGLELRYNKDIHGEPGTVVLLKDARGKTFQREEHAPQAGANLHTTLDLTIQHIVEKELQEAAARTHATGISIVVVDPHSGAILAMANHPTFNPNDHLRYSPQSWQNRAIASTYEPGSTFKIVTATAALEEGLTTPDERIDCLMGSIVLYNHRIKDHKPFGVLSVREIMQYSSDVGMIKLGLRVGDERFAGYIDRLGFGKRNGIDLPGEERGQTQPAAKWSKVSIGAISMGQEIAVTPLQIVNMVAAVANGGILYRPYVVQKIDGPDGITDVKPRGERVMSQTIAQQLQEMLEVVVTDGTARSSKLDGYRAAGKTGTAQKYDPKIRTYSNTKYIASFAGYAPASNPQIAMVVVVDEPRGLYHGGEVAAPIFKRIAEQVLRSRSVVPDVPQYAPQYKPSIKPQPKLDPLLRVNQAPEWRVVPASTNGSFADSEASGLGDLVVPDFTGKSLRDVSVESSRLGLKLQSGTGSGRAVMQAPAPGTRVQPGTKIQVRFSTR